MTGIVQVGPLWRIATARMPTRWGMFDAIGFERDVSKGTSRVETALAIVMGDLTEGVPLLRIHSQCFTGEILGSLRCDCHDQLEMAMQAIAEEARGLIIYEYQEGRGIGLMAKLEAYELQDAGLDTVEANHALGFKADCRDFNLPAAILRDLGIKRVRLLSNNPGKASALAANGVEVVAQLTCEAASNPHSFAYLQTKKERMGHALRRKAPRPFLASLAAVTTETSMSTGGHAALRPRAKERRGGKRWTKLSRNDPKASFAWN
jgi:GTP cyclohydrolase II